MEIEKMFASQIRARTVNLHIALANTMKDNSFVAEYFAKMKSLGDEMVAAGRVLDDEEMVEYILTRLGEDFSQLVTALTARVEPITVGELYSQLLNFETRMDLTYGSRLGSANAASRGHSGGRGGGSRGHDYNSVGMPPNVAVAEAFLLVAADREVVDVATTAMETTTLNRRHQLLMMTAHSARYPTKPATPQIVVGTSLKKTPSQIHN